MGYRVAVVGATGAVGREMLKTLAEQDFPSPRSSPSPPAARAGQQVSFGDKKVLKVQNLDKFDFTGWDIGLFAPGAEVSAVHAPRAAEAGCIVIDNTSPVPHGPRRAAGGAGGQPAGLAAIRTRHHRQPQLLDHPDGGGAEAAARSRHGQARRGVHLSVGLRRRQGGDGRAVQPDPRASSSTTRSSREQFTKQIAFNVIPHIDMFMADGSTKEEWKMVVETQKILDPDIEVHATCVRVPVFIGHAEAVNVEFERPITAAKAPAALRECAGGRRASITASRRAAMSPRPKCPARTPSMSAASATTRRSSTAWPSGACRTTCARARR